MKLRLLVITEIIAPYRIPVFNALARHAEVEPQIVFLAETDPSVRQWRIYADEIRFSYEVLPSWRTRLGKYGLLVNQNVGEMLRATRPDVILCGGYNYLASWQAQHWATRNRVPFFLWCESTVSDQRPGHLLIESLKQTFIDKCDGFVVPGKSAKTYVEQMSGRTEYIHLAPNAVDNELFARYADAARLDSERLKGMLGLPSRFFLFVGRLFKGKGVFDLLDAYRMLSDAIRSEVGLVFAGDGPHRAELESHAHSIYPGAVHFAGFVHRDELASYYGLAECFVFPTHSDTWGMVVNEAMACGLPVICSKVAGCAADLVKDNGRIVAARDASQLRRAMTEIACDPSLRQRMSVRSSQLIQSYSPEQCASGIARAALSMCNISSGVQLREPSSTVEQSDVEV